MHRRLLIFSVGLVLSITLKPIPISGQLSAAQQKNDKPNPPNNGDTTKGVPKPPIVIPPADPSPYTGEETRNAANDNKKVQGDIRDATVALAKDTHYLADYTLALVVVGIIIGGFQIYLTFSELRYTAKSAQDSEMALIASNEPAILLRHIRMTDFEADRHPLFHSTFGNDASGAAINVRITMSVTITESNAPDIPYIIVLGEERLAKVGARSAFATDRRLTRPLTFDTVNNMKNGTCHMLISGLIRYADRLGTTYEQEYRAQYLAWAEPRPPGVPEFTILS